LFPEVEETLQAEKVHKLSAELLSVVVFVLFFDEFHCEKVESSQQVALTKYLSLMIINSFFRKLTGRVSEREVKKKEEKPKKKDMW
jgi:hypothetical protein